MGRRTAYLHIGLAHTGGDFLAAALAGHADTLKMRGVRVPSTSSDEMLRAAIEIRRDHKAWGYRRREVEGTWAEVCRRARKGKQDVVLSGEHLAGCTPSQIDLLLDTLSEFDVELIVTAGDPGTQRFADGQDLAAVLTRWSAVVASPDRVHVLVTDPGAADPRASIWAAVGRVVGFEPDDLPLGVAPVGSGGLAQDLVDLAETWRKHLAEGGYDVRGDSALLLPAAH